MLTNQLVYPQPIEDAIALIIPWLENFSSCFTPRSWALLLLQHDPEAWQNLPRSKQTELETVINNTETALGESITTAVANTRQQLAWNCEHSSLIQGSTTRQPISEWLHKIVVYPLTGFPILVVILYFGVYKFVGEFGAGTLVDIIETFFESRINPVVNNIIQVILPWQPIQDLIGNEYGIITLGVRYAVAIILPVVATFFFMFSILEDSGYLPRLSLLMDRFFKAIGLEGRAVIPMVLGLGCGTMATLVTRTLETKRERIIATLLLASTVPCAAQLGVVLGLLSQSGIALTIWIGLMLAIFIVIGFLSNKILPGEKPYFYMEIPPLRLPRLGAIIKKTYIRLKWYFGEILPLFIYASVIIWIGKLTGIFDFFINLLKPVVATLGLPPSTAQVFLYGFFRRDYGAAGLFDLQQQGTLNNHQLIVAAITLTLFIPCIAQLQFMIKERGLKVAALIAVFVFVFAFVMGFLVNQSLTLINVGG
ncbi:MAG: ferrous iron transporter B [Calothrix sp. MO_192.B10]|nr:ferrous iron transporter B [Calothrix sp. MO_192.B10]